MIRTQILGDYEKMFQPILLLVLLIALITGLGFYSDVFLTGRNWLNILNNHMAHQLILAVGMTFVICTGGIDLAASSILALSGIIMAMLANSGTPLCLSIVFALFASLLMGTLNGLLVSSFTINPLIITLGTASLFRGLAVIITGGMPIYGLPRQFHEFAMGSFFIPIPIIMAGLILLAALIILRMTKWGLYSMVIGSNSTALTRLGVNVKLYKTSVYALSGLMAGTAMLIITSRLNTAEATAGIGMEMTAIAAVIMGGTLLSGGKGSMTGTAIACLLLAVIKNGLTLLSIDAQYQEFIIGFLLLLAVITTELKNQRN